MGNIESVDGPGEMKHHLMPLKVPMPDPSELEERFAIVLVSSLEWKPLIHFFFPSSFEYTFREKEAVSLACSVQQERIKDYKAVEKH